RARRLFGLLAILDIDARTDVADKVAAVVAQRGLPIRDVAIDAIMAHQPIFHLDIVPVLELARVRSQATGEIVGMNASDPTIADLLIKRPAGEPKPCLVDVVALRGWAHTPNQDRTVLDHETVLIGR